MSAAYRSLGGLSIVWRFGCRLSGPRIWAWIMAAGCKGQPAQVVSPAFGAACAMVAWHPAVDQAQQRASAFGCERHLDDAAAVQVGEVFVLPLPRKDD